jgi:hypothetical protein
MGVLQGGGTLAAVLASLVIGVVLFLGQ